MSKGIPSAKTKSVKKLAEKPVANIQEVTALLVHPPNLPVRPYLDDIWDVLTGFDGDLGDIGTDITDIQNDIIDIQTNCCGSDIFGDLDGGVPNSIYLIDQNVDGGGP